MQRTVLRWFAALACLFASTGAASAHVKWFLGRSEAEILRQPKPDLFNHLSLENSTLIVCAIAILVVSTLIGCKLVRSRFDQTISRLAAKAEPVVNLFMGICTGASLVYCSVNHTLLAPNFAICSHCPWWLAPLQCLTGCLIVLGLFSRLAALAFLALLAFTFLKHSVADCLDLVPLYGLALYFLLAGRGRFSFDRLFGIDSFDSALAQQLAHICVRLCTGLGLLILAFDEKLVHPQLALELLKHSPSLNFMSWLGVNNDMFVLSVGLAEVVLGLVLIVGSFPRMAALMLAGVFAATSVIFGSSELLGHLAYYGIIVSILLRGAGTPVETLAYSVRSAMMTIAFRPMGWKMF